MRNSLGNIASRLSGSHLGDSLAVRRGGEGDLDGVHDFRVTMEVVGKR